MSNSISSTTTATGVAMVCLTRMGGAWTPLPQDIAHQHTRPVLLAAVKFWIAGGDASFEFTAPYAYHVAMNRQSACKHWLQIAGEKEILNFDLLVVGCDNLNIGAISW